MDAWRWREAPARKRVWVGAALAAARKFIEVPSEGSTRRWGQ